MVDALVQLLSARSLLRELARLVVGCTIRAREGVGQLIQSPGQIAPGGGGGLRGVPLRSRCLACCLGLAGGRAHLLGRLLHAIADALLLEVTRRLGDGLLCIPVLAVLAALRVSLAGGALLAETLLKPARAICRPPLLAGEPAQAVPCGLSQPAQLRLQL